MTRSLPRPLSEGAAAFPWPAPSRGEVDQQVWDGLAFAAVPGYRPLFLDLHVPRTEAPPPLVVWLYGGSWQLGSRRRRSVGAHRHRLLERTLLAGFAVALVDYRHTEEAPFPAPVEDVRAAVRWLREHAGELGFDGGRIALWGESAGAHLACMAASCDRAMGVEPQPVAAVADWYGPVVLSSESESVAALLARSGWDDRAASPVTYARAGLPPVLIVHGRDDAIVPVGQSRAYRDALRAAGAHVEYEETAGGHVFDGAGEAMDLAIERTLAFLSERLDPAPAPAPGPPFEGLAERLRQVPLPPGRAVVVAGTPEAARSGDDILVLLSPGAAADAERPARRPTIVAASTAEAGAAFDLVRRLHDADVPVVLRVFASLDRRAAELLAAELSRLAWDR